MKISISTLPYYPQPIEDILEQITEFKMDYCEIINEYPHDSLDYELLKTYDVEYTIHAPLSDINPASHNASVRNSSVAEIKKSMDIARELGCEIVVVHPGYMPVLGRKLTPKIVKYNRDSLMECSQYAREVGISMCVENMPNIESLLYTNLEELDELILDIDAYMTLDVGHAHNNNYNIKEMLKYSRIKHIHLSDNDGSYDNHDAIGSQEDNNGVEFKTLLKELKKIKYDGLLVVEVEEPSAVVESIRYLKNNSI